MQFKLTVILTIVSIGVVLTAPAPKKGKTFVHTKLDFSSGQFGGGLCVASGKCSNENGKEITSIAAILAPIPHNCQAFCRNDYKETCQAAYYDPTNGECHLLSTSCTAEQLEDQPGFIYYQRLPQGVTECPDKFTTYEPPAALYSDDYCLTEGKRCEGPEMYRAKPWKNKNRQFCSDKCSRILTCGMVDWIPNPEQDVNDENALGTCYHKMAKCEKAALKDNAKSYNYLRLLKTEKECPSAGKDAAENPNYCKWTDMYCGLMDMFKLYRLDGSRIENVADVNTCLDWCTLHDNDPKYKDFKSGCRTVFFHAGSQTCGMARRTPCYLGHPLQATAGITTYYRKETVDQDCNELMAKTESIKNHYDYCLADNADYFFYYHVYDTHNMKNILHGT